MSWGSVAFVPDSLKDRWRMYVRPEHFEWTYAMLEALYSGGPRVYHTLEHIEDCLAGMEMLALEQPEGTINKQLAYLALIFHDAVYVPGQPDNEKNSVTLLEGLRFAFRDDLGADIVERIAPLILATAHKSEEVVFGDVTLAAVVDTDLSILGRGPVAYERYRASIRREFAHVSDDAWRVGRGGFLAKLLARKRIFTLARVRADLEAQARKNIAEELSTLQ
jgi:predicted metal-dependent HD superfamily phosphohydrolase